MGDCNHEWEEVRSALHYMEQCKKCEVDRMDWERDQRIAELEKQYAQLESDYQSLDLMFYGMVDMKREAQAEAHNRNEHISDLEAENKRLREALAKIICDCENMCEAWTVCDKALY